MRNRSHSGHTKRQSAETKRVEQDDEAKSMAVEVPTPGIISLALPVLLPLVVLAIVLVANLSLGQRPCDPVIKDPSSLSVASSMLERGGE